MSLFGAAGGTNHRVAEYANTLEFHLHCLTGQHRHRGSRRSGENEIAGVQRDVPAHVTDDRWNVEDEVGRVSLLTNLSVDSRHERQIVGIESSGDEGTDGPKAV